MTNPTPFPRYAALVAGLGLLTMTGLGPFGLLTLQGLSTGEASADTLAAIAEGARFAGVIWAFVVIALADIAVAVALHVIVHRDAPRLSALAMALRVIYAVILGLLVIHLTTARGLAGDGGPAALAAIGRFMDGWTLSLGIFGAHLLALCAAALRGQIVPHWLAWLVGLAGLAYVVDAAGPLILPGYSLTLAAWLFFGELLLMLWLLFRSWRP
jgi:hypothetical protein